MTFQTLKDPGEIQAARDRLAAEGLLPSRWIGGPRRWLTHLVRARRLPPPPDVRKSWDLDLTLRAIRDREAPMEVVLDLGAYNSAVLPALVKLGYRNLVGVDLNPQVKRGPHRRSIRYLVGDIYQLPLEDASCDVVTAISTIEHGWRGGSFFDEVARVLRPGGLLLASTDFWPDKIDTSSRTFFGMSWTIFSKEEIRGMIERAAAAGLVAEGPEDYSIAGPVIHWNDCDYTFGFLRLRRAARPGS
jgi:SAM-dependent methyltransferase